MEDRFGPIPPQVEDLFRTVRARRLAVALGFEKMLLKDNLLKCHFVPNHESPYFQSETFNRILEFVTTRTNKAQLKQIGVHGILFVREIKSMEALLDFLGKMHGFVTVKEAIQSS
jgi:transcription-repair coupling factor (superfamily II helicase)